MRTSIMSFKSAVAGAVVVSVGFVAAPMTASAAGRSGPTISVVASNLNNPRGLSVSQDGTLYLAEAGRGSNTHCLTDPSGTSCAGLTGSIDAVGAHGVRRIVKGLISVSGAGGIGAEGMVAVSASGSTVYGQFAANTFMIPPSGLPNFLLQAAHHDLGQFGRATNGAFIGSAGVGDSDFLWSKAHQNLNPQQFPDSNPNGVLVTAGERFVADAGANTLDEVDGNGKVEVLAYFGVPARSQTDAVPTCVAKGPDGALYVGELLGGNFAPGHARIWRVTINDDKVTKSVWARGLTTVQGCGFDRWGNFYATEFQTHGLDEGPTANPSGAIVKIAPNGTRTTLGDGRLVFPSGFAAQRDGSVFVSNCSIAPGTGFGPCPNGGEVLRIH
jgi:hypothetical protein